MSELDNILKRIEREMNEAYDDNERDKIKLAQKYKRNLHIALWGCLVDCNSMMDTEDPHEDGHEYGQAVNRVVDTYNQLRGDWFD
tara:strand:+ start:489 stop:743 length:255 start_codon:yes stop_codon:yes gene_type:complete